MKVGLVYKLEKYELILFPTHRFFKMLHNIHNILFLDFKEITVCSWDLTDVKLFLESRKFDRINI